ncbi:MAG TPA: hypothetical protein VMD49_05270 [Steroidobacteraceae bacterium]|nr:hypothetical protein [Steroidobacteraceae bacterium]
MSFLALSRDAAGLPGALRRELLLLGAALACGVLAVPPLLWVAGPRALGPYAGGGVTAIVANFFRGLASGSIAFWLVALGPYLVLTALRALVALLRSRSLEN